MCSRAVLSAETCAHRLFERQVERTPDAEAVRFRSDRLTYRALNRRANQLAHRLRRLGVGPGVLVALCAERSPEALLGLLAVLKAGGAYLPIDPAYPRDRVAFMLEDAGAPVLLTQARVLPSLPRHRARAVLLDADRDAGGAGRDAASAGASIDGASDGNPAPAAGPDDLAYVIYTSGSTGRPKGALLPHRGLTNLALALIERFAVTPDSRVLQFASLSFDASIWEIAVALVAGARLVMGTRAEMMPGEALVDFLRTERVTTALLPPAALAVMPEGAERALPELRTLIAGGEACPGDLAARWAPGRRFFNAYGPTEATVIATLAECAGDGAAPPIGRPIPGARCYVLDASLRQVPEGERGELYLGGAGLAWGYLGRPGLTAPRFLPDPFSTVPGARLYRTGDLVRLLPGGDLDFLGRADHQVKIRGHRVELGEIEAALGRHPAVRAAVVVHREGALIAYVVARAGERSPDQRPRIVRGLRRHLREQLPAPMLPSAYVLLDALPLTPNGKVDRAALPPPDGAQSEREAEIAPPRNDVEATIAAVWAEALGLEAIGVHDNVFELGGHSLLAARVRSRVRDALGVELPLQRVFEAPTVAALAAVVASCRPEEQRAISAGRDASLAAIRRVPRDRPLPVSHGQRQIWLHASLHPGALLYNEPFSLRMAGPLDSAAFARAFQEVRRRHEILRTTFAVVDGEPVQRIHPAEPFELPIVDLTELPAAARWDRALALAAEEARRPFDLARGPLLRATLVRLADTDHVLFVTVHHILMDGVSVFHALRRELWALYQAFSAGKPSPLPELAIQYADVAVWQRERATSAALRPHIEALKQQLADLPTLELPTARPRPAIPSQRGARHCVALSADLTRRLNALAQYRGVTLFVVLLSAFKVLLFRYTGQEEIVVGTPVSCRDRPEMEGLIGFFLNTLVLRTDMRGDPTFGALLDRVRGVIQAALARQDVPFATLVESLQPRRAPGQNPLFQVAFVLEPPAPPPRAGEAVRGAGWSMSQLDLDTGASKFDLTLELDERPEGIIGRIEYSTDRFDTRTIKRMAGHYEVLLAGACDNPDLRLSELPLLTPEERRALLDWGRAPRGPGAGACVHHLFEAEARRAPEACAVVFDDGAGSVTSLSYDALNRRANRLAHRLLGLGVAPEGRVAICMYRSIEMIVAMLGALKAGLAYVPLDPAYPTERLAFMLEQSGAGVVLTQLGASAGVPVRDARVLFLDTDWEIIARERDDDPARPAWPEQLAYVMYTSGSTGRPKGVAVPHRGVARLVKGTSYARLTADEVFLQLAPTAFDASTFEIWGALLNGGRLVIMPPTPPSVEGLLRVIREHGVTTLWLTAGVFRLLVDERLADLRGLRQLLAGGDVLSPQHVNRVIAELDGCRMVNGYGPTESTTFACCATIDVPVAPTVPIGRPIPGTRVHVLDDHLHAVPIGVPGELCIGGEGLARGYIRLPQRTAERFIPDPTGIEPGARLYRTGDRVRWTPDGQIEFLGRMDQQVKVRGYRTEPREIEVVLSAHPLVRDAVVEARPDRSGDKRLVAYIVTDAHRWQPPGTIERLIVEHARRLLPDTMVPSAVVLLDRLPLTANGKVDRRALPVPEDVRAGGAPVSAPQSLLEERLAAIWQDVLGLGHVSVHDNFFDLGGHSLLLMRLHERIRESLRSDVSIVDLFARPTISDFATFLGSGGGDDLSEVDARARKQRETLRRRKQAAAKARSKPYGSA